MLDVLGFRINTPTAHTFLSMYKQVGIRSPVWHCVGMLCAGCSCAQHASLRKWHCPHTFLSTPQATRWRPCLLGGASQACMPHCPNGLTILVSASTLVPPQALGLQPRTCALASYLAVRRLCSMQSLF